MVSGAAVIVVSRYRAVAGGQEALLSAITETASLATASEGCFGSRICASDQDGSAVVVVSRWVSEAALSAFAHSEAFIERRDRYTPLLARPPVEEHLRPV